MSHLRQSGESRAWLTQLSELGLILILSLFNWNAFASDLGDAEKALSEATNKFYNTLYSNPRMSRDEINKLYNDTVVPAQQKVPAAFSSTIQQQWSKAYDSMKTTSDQIEQGRRNFKPKATVGGKAGNGAQGTHGVRGGPAQPADTGPSEPEVVLDGKGIATEIEFKGKSKRVPRKGPSPKPAHAPAARTTPAPRATPAPSPTVVDIKGTAAPSGGVEEIEFGSKPAAKPVAKPSTRPAH